MDPDASYEEEQEEDAEGHETEEILREVASYQGSASSDLDDISSDEKAVAYESRHSQKRRAEIAAVEPILKRHKGLFNNSYLDILNGDTLDAANQLTAGGEEDLPASQIGLTVWTPFEKKQLFEAIIKLGKGDLRGISSRIRTKSEIEVRQYIVLLEDALQRRDQELANGVEPLEIADYPAAVEVSQTCCHALEEAADALSFRQERHEELAEQKKWGECWNITRELVKRIEGDHGLEKEANFMGDHGLAFTEMLRIKNFLRLPERIFMNASNVENNWQFVSEEPPTIRASALQDLHSLLVSVTKKIVVTTLFVAQSRIRGKRKVVPTTSNTVRRKDVEAAVASLGLKQNSNEFWASCARRLHLEVWDEDHDSQDGMADEEEQMMSYDQVENILRQESDRSEPANPTAQSATPEIKFGNETSSESDGEATSSSEDSCSASSTTMGEAEHEVTEEAKEVLKYSAYDFPKTYRTKEALKLRIRNERGQEDFADAEDAKATHEAELELWRLLQRQPPEPLPKPESAGRGRRGLMDVEDVYDVGRQWRERLRYHSEWEMLGAPRLPDKQP
ncbi:DNA-binding protein [Colletotrichum sojae]|uniref:DNA-binding protein n=1 Tax=Colletotrichum sojae TaxID=2175907 RepID=A0A8H6N641_9PEZI|nr:DNA-binding protein [Colletotrichum sojae]